MGIFGSWFSKGEAPAPSLVERPIKRVDTEGRRRHVEQYVRTELGLLRTVWRQTDANPRLFPGEHEIFPPMQMSGSKLKECMDALEEPDILAELERQVEEKVRTSRPRRAA